MARKILSALTLALVLALTPSTAHAQEDFGGGGGVDYGSYDSGGYGGYDTGSSYDTTTYDPGTSPDQWGGSGYDALSGSSGSGSVLSGSDGIDTNDVASGQPAPWDPPALGNDPWTNGTTADPYASSTDPWATTAATDPWASSNATDPAPTDPWSSNVSSDPYTSTSNDPWATTSTSNDPWTNGTAPDPYASATDPWATTASNDPWASTGSSEPAPGANDGWTSSTSSPDGWTSSAPDGWNSSTASPEENGLGAAPSLAPGDQAQRNLGGPLDSSYVPSAQAERVVQLAGTATPAERQLLQQRFDALPLGARNALEANGTRIVTCRDDVTDSIPGLASTRSEDGRTGRDLGGVYAPRNEATGVSQPTVAVCTTLGPDGQPRFSSLQGSRDLFGHEVGHGVDAALGYPSQRDPAFREALGLDRAMAQGGDPASQRVLGSYYNGQSAFGYDRGASESYAEGFANYVNRDMSWGGTYEYFRSQPNFQLPRR